MQRRALRAAARDGDVAQVRKLLALGAPTGGLRRDRSPYRLAMARGRLDVLRELGAAGVRPPPGSRPPAALPGAMVLRPYLPVATWWLAMVIAVAALVAAVALRQWAFLIVTAAGPAICLLANAMLGRTRIAVDGPLLAVRPFARWQGPVDLRELAALGYGPSSPSRMPARWQLVQDRAGAPLNALTEIGLDPEQIADLRNRPALRVLTVYAGRGFGSPGLDLLFAQHLAGTAATLSAGARYRLAHAVTHRRAGPDTPR